MRNSAKASFASFAFSSAMILCCFALCASACPQKKQQQTGNEKRNAHAAAKHASKNTPPVMNANQEKAIQSLTMEHETYFSIDKDNIVDIQARFANASGGGQGPLPAGPNAVKDEEGFLALKIPEYIEEGKHATIPALVGVVQSGRRAWEVAYNQNLVSILTDLQTGEVRIQWPFIMDKRASTPPPSMHGSEPNALNAGAMQRGVRFREIRDLYRNLPWPPGFYALTVICYDWRSNSQVFELQSSTPAPKRSVPAEFKDLFESIKLSASEASAGTTGFSQSLPSTARLKESIPLTLSLNMPVKETGLVHALESKDGGHALPVAVVLITKDDDYPTVLNFLVPARISDGPNGEQASFSTTVDLAKGVTEELKSGNYLCYVNVGRHVFGPQTVHIDAD